MERFYTITRWSYSREIFALVGSSVLWWHIYREHNINIGRFYTSWRTRVKSSHIIDEFNYRAWHYKNYHMTSAAILYIGQKKDKTNLSVLRLLFNC